MKGLKLIGEKINYSIRQTGRLLDAGDYGAIRKIARAQEEKGADYIDVNVGPLPPAVMADVVRAVSEAVTVPLCIDSTDPATLEAGISAYDAGSRGGGRPPILNSATEYQAEAVLGLRRRFACQVVLLVSERLDAGTLKRNRLPEEALRTARRLVRGAVQAGFHMDDIYIDPGIPPLSHDIEGLVNKVLDAMALVRHDPVTREAHVLIGISNFTAGLPGGVRLPLQNALLTLALRNGLDTVIGDPGKAYAALERGDEYMVWLEHILASEGVRRLEAITSSPFYRAATGRDGKDKGASN
jgi:5-methyltetrahydrofolate--homocysteine methyltransferase